MGTSPSIDDMQKKDDEFRAYLNTVQADLDAKSSAAAAAMADDITAFYTNNKYDDAKDFVSGKNTDFMHQSEFSLANVKNIIDSVSAAVFAGAAVPKGASVNAEAVATASEAMGTQAGSMANMELYIAGKVFDVLSNVILSFGSSTSMSFSSAVKSESLGYGLQLFTSISASSYESHGFFNNETINQYLYQYDVRWSHKQAEVEDTMGLAETLSNVLAAMEQNMNKTSAKLAHGDIDMKTFAGAYAEFKSYVDAIRPALADAKRTELQAAH